MALLTVHFRRPLICNFQNDHRLRVYQYRSVELLWAIIGGAILTVHFWQSSMTVHFRDQLTRGYTWLRRMLHGSILVSIQLFMQWWIRAFEKVNFFLNSQKFQKIIIQKSEYFKMLKHLIKARTSHQSEKSVHRRVNLWVSPKTYV